AADELVDRVDRERARDLAAFVAAHAVGDHEQTEIGARADSVLVVGATTGDAEGERFELHAPCKSARRAAPTPRRRGLAWGGVTPARRNLRGMVGVWKASPCSAGCRSSPRACRGSGSATGR